MKNPHSNDIMINDITISDIVQEEKLMHQRIIEVLISVMRLSTQTLKSSPTFCFSNFVANNAFHGLDEVDRTFKKPQIKLKKEKVTKYNTIRYLFSPRTHFLNGQSEETAESHKI